MPLGNGLGRASLDSPLPALACSVNLRQPAPMVASLFFADEE